MALYNVKERVLFDPHPRLPHTRTAISTAVHRYTPYESFCTLFFLFILLCMQCLISCMQRRDESLFFLDDYISPAQPKTHRCKIWHFCNGLFLHVSTFLVIGQRLQFGCRPRGIEGERTRVRERAGISFWVLSFWAPETVYFAFDLPLCFFLSFFLFFFFTRIFFSSDFRGMQSWIHELPFLFCMDLLFLMTDKRPILQQNTTDTSEFF